MRKPWLYPSALIASAALYACNSVASWAGDWLHRWPPQRCPFQHCAYAGVNWWLVLAGATIAALCIKALAPAPHVEDPCRCPVCKWRPTRVAHLREHEEARRGAR